MHIGQIVYSIKGRDAGGYFAVVDTKDEFVYICDGKVHRLEKPKKKKVKHVKATNEISQVVKNKLINKENITNKELRRILSSFKIENGILYSKEV